LIIAIDGPAGAGKSTVSKRVAQKLNFLYLDTGAMYRALTLKVIRKKFDFSDSEKILETARNSQIDFADNGKRTILDGEDVSELIRQTEIDEAISDIVKNPEARKIMVKKQRQFAKEQSLVAEGRDITTVVFPNADLKIFLTASVEIRAKRRYEEFMSKGIDVSFDEITEQIKQRDRKDSNRKHAPLKIADEAIVIDSTPLTIDQVVGKIIGLVVKENG